MVKEDTNEKDENWQFSETTEDELINRPKWGSQIPLSKREIVYEPIQPSPLKDWLENK